MRYRILPIDNIPNHGLFVNLFFFRTLILSTPQMEFILIVFTISTTNSIFSQWYVCTGYRIKAVRSAFARVFKKIIMTTKLMKMNVFILIYIFVFIQSINKFLIWTFHDFHSNRKNKYVCDGKLLIVLNQVLFSIDFVVL